MLLSDLPLQACRRPRIRALANGVIATHVVSADINSNNHYAADRFRLTLAIDPVSAAAWCSTVNCFVDVQFSLNAGSKWTSIVQGAVDVVDYDPIAGKLFLSGRDLTAALIEARTHEAFVNQTSSEIAELLARRHNLVPDVVPTSTLVGRYWQLEHDRVTLDQFSSTTTEWDLLVTLAQHEGYDVWVSGTTLHFRPVRDNNEVPVTLRVSGTKAGLPNVIGARLQRSLTLARDIQVEVKSWNSRQQAAFVQTARNRSRDDAPRRPPRRYVFVVPNLSPDAALKLAQQKLAELTRRERTITIEMPGDIQLRPRMQAKLAGTGTEFDQIYWIDEIDRRLDFNGGFTQRVRASNSNVTSQATSPADRIGTPWTGFSTS